MHWCKIFITLAIGIQFAFAQPDKNDENIRILSALTLLQSGDLAGASKIYEELFDATKKAGYLYEAANIALAKQDMPRVKALIKKGEKTLSKEPPMMRIKFIEAMSENKTMTAKDLASNLVKIEPKNAKNFIMLASAHMLLGDEDTALSNYKKAYEIDQSENVVIEIAAIISKKNPKEAVQILENFRSKNECSPMFYEFLASQYDALGEKAKIAQIFTELYEKSQDPNDAQNAMAAYVDANDLAGLKNFKQLVSSETLNADAFTNAKFFMHSLSALNDHASAIAFAKEMFESTGDLSFKALEAIFLYEQTATKPDQKTLQRVVANFEASVEATKSALFYNYYGYLLIDHDIDVKKGIALVEKALALEPLSPYYIDSLAWGQYKIGQCSLARKTMQKALQIGDFKDDPEAIEHVKKIDECIKKEAK